MQTEFLLTYRLDYKPAKLQKLKKVPKIVVSHCLERATGMPFYNRHQFPLLLPKKYK
jgi:hypothetical protein